MTEVLVPILIFWTAYSSIVFVLVIVTQATCVDNSTRFIIRFCMGPFNIVFLIVPLAGGLIHFVTTCIYGCYICNHSPAPYFIYTRNPFKIPCIKRKLRNKKYSDTIWIEFYKIFAKKISFAAETNNFILKLKHKNTDNVVFYA